MFDTAVGLAPEARSAFLAAECAGDPSLLDEVTGLLAADTASAGDGFLREAISGAVQELPRDTFSRVGRHVGPYRLVAELGHGGMGTVYLAERADAAYQAQVAIKFVRGGLAGFDAERRFRAERQILADLAHPNIARLIDGGTADDGTPYLVMDLVEGEAIDHYCEHRGLDLRARLGLFRAVCTAVQYAHQALVVHRDLKPSNILVTGDGTPKLLDFGIAKLLDSGSGAAGDTGTLMRALTPTYASPEHIRGARVTVPADVYSLGVVLYKLLTGRLPFDVPGDASPGEIERLVCDEEPRPPSVSDRRLAGDLDAIVLKALRKEPERRYATVVELAEDVRRYLAGEPVSATRGTTAYRLSRFARRHARALALAGSIVTVIVGIVGFYTLRVARARDRAQQEAARAEQVSRFLTQTFAVADPAQGFGASGPNATARDLLVRGTNRIETELAGQPRTQAVMLGAVGQVYQGLGLYREATPLFERALALQHEHDGDNLDIAQAEYDLGALAIAKGDYPTSDSLLRSALARRRAHLPPDDPAVIRTLVAVARVGLDRAQYAEAEPLLREAVASARQLTGEGRKELPIVLSTLGEVRQRRGDYAEADALFTETLALRRALFGESHPSVPETLHLLGMLHIARNLADADTLLREAYLLARRTLGEEHPTVATYLRDYAVLLRELARLYEADSLLRSALERHRRTLGDDHPLVADDLLALGLVHYGKPVGEAIARDALARMRRVYRGDHPQIVGALNMLGNMVSDRGDNAGALPYYRDAAAMARRLFGDAHDQVISPELNLAVTLQWMERYAEAEPLLVASHSAAQRVLGDAHARTDIARAELAFLYLLTGRTATAEPLLRESLEHRRSSLGSQHVATSDVLLGLSVVAAAGGRGNEAELLAREAAPAYAAAGADWQHALAGAVLGNALLAQGRYAEAEPLLFDGYRRLRARFPNGLSYLSWVRGRLAVLYEATGRSERAAQLRRR